MHFFITLLSFEVGLVDVLTSDNDLKICLLFALLLYTGVLASLLLRTSWQGVFVQLRQDLKGSSGPISLNKEQESR